MRILKALSGVVLAAVLLVGCKGGEKKVENIEEKAVTQEAPAVQGAVVPAEDSVK
jgi:uncharacterized lipoprotein YajG